MKHQCHALFCKEEIPPRLLMCFKHWCMVPEGIQKRVLAYYREGQCHDKRPSREYLKAAREAISYVAKLEKQVGETNTLQT